MKKILLTKLSILLVAISLFTNCPGDKGDDTLNNLTTLYTLDPGIFGGCVFVYYGAKSVYPAVTATKGGGPVNIEVKNSSGANYMGFVLMPNLQVGDVITVGLPATDTISFRAYKGECPFSTTTGQINMPATTSDIDPGMVGDQTDDGTTYTVQIAGDYIVKYDLIGAPDPNYHITLEIQ
ncbi:hypothetical protein CH352_05120 [Leptospira hartskeerlii]|uniref:Lipoprotein n=1 Tax=Leptospira hartskeerlii TaxID=2023177 RepID=A0A2M9XG37_9LEPT|nr:hypothetical protein [Leptospira hartskeerlii]PJZ26542.1 hypothetical protein CH357_03335 [Leptospira hartskeerlii]PJZ34975.1 hypothetical protein CH352_05120 [Leptospira hartskeerlii]